MDTYLTYAAPYPAFMRERPQTDPVLDPYLLSPYLTGQYKIRNGDKNRSRSSPFFPVPTSGGFFLPQDLRRGNNLAFFQQLHFLPRYLFYSLTKSQRGVKSHVPSGIRVVLAFPRSVTYGTVPIRTKETLFPQNKILTPPFSLPENPICKTFWGDTMRHCLRGYVFFWWAG